MQSNNINNILNNLDFESVKKIREKIDLSFLDKVKKAISDLKQGKAILVLDSKEREDEVDFVVAAEKIKPEHIVLLAKQGGGLLCLALEYELFEKLDFKLMKKTFQDTKETAMGLAIDAHPRFGIKTGISAKERAITINLVTKPWVKKEDFVVPGHIIPLKAKKNLLLEREGHTEASVCLCKLANLKGAAAICEIMKDDGNMLSSKEAEEFAKKYNYSLVSIEEIKKYIFYTQKLLKCEAEAHIKNKFGTWKIKVYKEPITNKEHVALVFGNVENEEDVLVRVHSSCLTGDVFGSYKCDCQNQLHEAMKLISSYGKGILIYLNQEGRGIGLTNKIKAYALQEQGLDTVEANKALGFKADERNFYVAGHILKDLGPKSVILITNNPNKIKELILCGINVKARLPLICIREENKNYLETKKKKLGHLINSLKNEG